MEKRITRGGAKIEELIVPWGNLDSDIMLMIFDLLPIDDLFFQISVVCRSWRSTFWEFLFSSLRNYGTLDLSPIREIVAPKYGLGLGLGFHQYPDYDIDYFLKTQYETALEKFLNAILKNPRVLRDEERAITTLLVPSYMNLSPSNLTLISQKTPCLKKLELRGPEVVEDLVRFDEALEHWKSLEDVSIGPVSKLDIDHLIRALGAHSEKLRTMKIEIDSWPWQDVFLVCSASDRIAENLGQLEEISLTRLGVEPNSVSRLLDRCRNLTTLSMNNCGFVKKGRWYLNTVTVSRSSKTAINWRLSSGEELLSCDEVDNRLFW